MRAKVTLRRALEDGALLGATFGGPSWHAWRSLLLATMGEPLNPDELATFTKFTGRAKSPDQRVAEAWFVIGRRGGKSAASAALAIYLAGLCDHSAHLSRGEKGLVLLLASDRRQAKILLDYCEGVLRSTPMLSQLIKERTREEIALTTGISIEVRTASLRGVRGYTCISVIGDEVAFWRSEEGVNPDEEILGALRPTLLTTKGMLVALSSPYARKGALWSTYKKQFGPDGDPAILVALQSWDSAGRDRSRHYARPCQERGRIPGPVPNRRRELHHPGSNHGRNQFGGARETTRIQTFLCRLRRSLRRKR